MIRNIVFDIGGVLADFNVNGFLGAKGFDGAMIRRILKASVMTPYWGAFERGEITEEEAFKGFAGADPEIGDALYRAFSNVEGMLTSRAYVIPLVKALKAAGCGVYYLSNYSKKAYDECGESLSFMPSAWGGPSRIRRCTGSSLKSTASGRRSASSSTTRRKMSMLPGSSASAGSCIQTARRWSGNSGRQASRSGRCEPWDLRRSC